MVRFVAFVFLCAVFAIPAIASKRVNVQQLEQALSELHGKPDSEAAWQIASLQLTERLTPAKLAQIQASLAGDQSKQALAAVADEAAFLDPPPTELPVKPAPDLAEQRRMMGLVVGYVRDAIPRLPNFFASRDTTSFEDTPQLQTPEAFVPYAPLHFVNHSHVTVLYREGREVEDAGASPGKKSAPASQGLSTYGVFGPILSTVLLDAAQSKLAWGHWEQGPAGLEAIFSYAVPKEKSHYEVNYCCVAEIGASVVANVHPFRQIVGYHGALAIDPATGAILRLIAEAELKPTDPVSKANILVEYSNVEIAGKRYLCPVRSVSSAVGQTIQVDPKYKFALARQMQPLKNSVNEVSFQNYHVFRSDSRVLTGEEANLAQISNAHDAAVGLPPLSASAPPGLRSPNLAETSNASGAAPIAPSETVAAAPPAPIPAPEPEIPEIAIAPATELPDTPIMSTPPDPNSAFTLRTTTRLVDVALVAYDKKGHPVTDLKPEDLEVDDNGQKQTIRFFSRASAETAPAANPQSAQAAAPAEPASFTNRPASAEQVRTTSNGNITILLIDAANVAFGDLTYARLEMLRFLKTLQPEERVGLYIMKSYGFQILLEPTADHAQVATTLTHWMPSAQDLARAQDEEQHNRQQIDWVHSTSDLAYINGNDTTDPEGNATSPGAVAELNKRGIDPQLRSMGRNPQQDVLARLEIIARHLAVYPEHKSLVWISSDNALADWSGQAAGREDKGAKDLDPIAIRVRESLNESHVSIYPLDASQLEVGAIGAELRERNPVPVGLTSRSPELSVMGDADPGMKPGRITAQMHQDTHPIQGTFRELAEATGGRALRRAGDIAAELDTIVADGRAAYLLSFSPEFPADDKYHLIKIKLTNARDLKLRYRTGYLYSKEPATLKDRFHQAIWLPRDMNEIGVTVTPVWGEGGTGLSLNIATPDLEVAQQDKRWTDQLDVFVALRDDTGSRAKVMGHSLRLQMTPATYQKVLHDGIPFDQSIEGKADFASVRVVVVDENSGRMGSVTIPAAALKRTP